MGKKILIIDDDKDTLEICQLILKREGYEIATRANCTDVINDVLSTKPDLIFLDFRIPPFGGDVAMALLKENNATNNIPLFFFSAHTQIKDISKKHNANGYIQKPFNVADLIAKIFLQLGKA